MDLSIFTGKIALLGAALAIGLLIGLERGWSSRDVKEGERIAGIRTFGLIGLLGGCIGILTADYGGLVFGLALLGVCAVLLGSYVINMQARANISITSTIAAILTFTLGVLATLDYVVLAGCAAVIATFLLSIKPVLHGWVKRLAQEELYAAIKLLLISVVLLSILPNRAMGPFDAINPFEVWWMVVLVATISFVGYFAMKIAGPKTGSFLTALFAGLTSSTALTYEYSKIVSQRPTLATLLSAEILMACGIMFLRMLFFVAILNPSLLLYLSIPAFVIAFLLFLPMFFLWIKPEKTRNLEDPELKNPLDLKSALIFGGILLIVTLLIKVIVIHFNTIGLFGLSVAAGLVDIDAFVLPTARMGHELISYQAASFAILLAAFSNTCFKAMLALAIGGKQMLWKVTIPMILSVILAVIITGIVLFSPYGVTLYGS